MVLFDVTNAEESLDEKRLGHIVLKQLADAEIIAINKIDLVNESTLAKYEDVLKSVNTSAVIVRISALKEVGLDELVLSLRV